MSTDRSRSVGTVTELVLAAFRLASQRHRTVRQAWVGISHRVGGEALPKSELVVSIQRMGELDVLLRCMEEEAKADMARRQDLDGGLDCQLMLSEMWICNAYEIFRLLQSRKLADQNGMFTSLADDLKLLRITIAKHEIANDRKLPAPVPMVASTDDDASGRYVYSRSDQSRAHIMSKDVSHQGSFMWEAIDGKSCDSRWLERLSLSERILSLWQAAGRAGAERGPA